MEIKKYTSEYEKLAKDFECGNVIIDKFLQDGSALDVNQGITYVMLSKKKDFIIGYYNIEVGRIDQVETVGKYEVYKPMGGAININYLAIHSKYQGTQIAEIDDRKIYLGDYLLRDCEKRVLELRKQVGISFITLCSTEQGYHLYHERNCYEDFEEDMKNFVEENSMLCYKVYKCVDDIIEI